MPRPTDLLDRTLVAVEGISKTYSRTRVLSDVSLGVERGKVHALVGGNGSGKSTLIKLLAGVVPADPGGHIVTAAGRVGAEHWSAHAARRAHLRFVHQDLGLFDDLTVTDNLCIGPGYGARFAGRVHWPQAHERTRRALHRLGVEVDPRARVGGLSIAEHTMVAVTRALQDVDSDTSACIVLDEPTAALAGRDSARLLAMLRTLTAADHAVILVTHHIDDILDVADRVTVLRDGRIVYGGPRMDLDRPTLVRHIAGAAVAAGWPGPEREGPGDSAGVLLDLSWARARHTVPDSLVVRRGEVVGLAGLPGSGYEEISPALFGLLPLAGTALLDGKEYRPRRPAQAMREGVAFIPADRLRDGVFGDLPILNNATAASTRASGVWRIHHRRERRAARGHLHSYRVRPLDLQLPIRALSGGNQQKVLLARWEARKPRLLLLEDPTRGVDVGAREEIWELLRTRVRCDDLAILTTSSDYDELARRCDRVVVMGNGRIVRELAGPDVSASTITRAVYDATEVLEPAR
ncbi:MULTISPECIES: sugar ABC transporter ATP-binding protein [unclassified Pseudofrankia]|uniref:sugar ABC transporter ATP-binding protein n=1 Tax=unclassified Pseudofrankia TaxID=2994372 RepID=UPI0008D9F30E|nr:MULTISPECIES: sugar ABC transporter ATP-binding protein [unclassified Pseudofrankia]MDT3446329.1 sugar ABC transporter ATP-binding protein [Pseudofrankia sp. BMG5.37]OHV56736.1 hypothetical protein BCD48_43585 [Pseudofrankia sp. BMG5.36]